MPVRTEDDQRLEDVELVRQYIDGMKPEALAAEMNMTKRAVYLRLAKPEVREMIREEIDFRMSVRRRFHVKHLEECYEFAAKVAMGKAKVETQEQVELLRFFIGAADPRAEVAAEPGQLTGGITVNMIAGDSRPQVTMPQIASPDVIEGEATRLE